MEEPTEIDYLRHDIKCAIREIGELKDITLKTWHNLKVAWKNRKESSRSLKIESEGLALDMLSMAELLRVNLFAGARLTKGYSTRLFSIAFAALFAGR